MGRWSLALAVLAVLALALPAAASGADARQYSIGVGQHPSVAVVTAGGATTVHVAWATTSGFPEAEGVLNAIGYCRIPPGARTCRDRQILLPLGRFGAGAAPELWTLDDGSLVITDGRGPEADQSGRWMLTSRDGGSTWSASNVSRVERGNSGLLTRARHLEVLDPADGTLWTVGSGFFSFGLPVNLARIRSTDVAPPPQDAEAPPDFASDGARRIYAEVLGRLPDGRLFAAGHDNAQRGNNVYARTALRGADPASPATGWTPWQPLPLSGAVWGTGSTPGRGPTGLLMGAGTGLSALQVVPFDGQRTARGRLIGGGVGLAVNEVSRDLVGAGDGDLHAVWLSQQEGCRRGTRCLLYTRLDRNLRQGPKSVVRTVPDTAAQPVLEFATVASNALGDAWVAWQERLASQRALPKIRLAQMCRTRPTAASPACQEHEAGLGAGRLATLTAPNLVTGRAFTALVSAAARVRRVEFRLEPPFCRPPRTGDQCHALRRPVTVVRTRAPFTARFAGLPVARTISTSDPVKNRHCGIDAYLYRLVAKVTAPGRTVTLRRDVSVCPRVG